MTINGREQQVFWEVLVLWAHLFPRYRFRALQIQARQGQLETQLLQDLLQVRVATTVANPVTILRNVPDQRKEAQLLQDLLQFPLATTVASLVTILKNARGPIKEAQLHHYPPQMPLAISVMSVATILEIVRSLKNKEVAISAAELGIMQMHAVCDERAVQMMPALAVQRTRYCEDIGSFISSHIRSYNYLMKVVSYAFLFCHDVCRQIDVIIAMIGSIFN